MMDLKKLEQHYLNLVTNNFPEISFKKTQLITKGWDNNVIILDDRLVFRFPKKDAYARRFKGEVKVLDYLSSRVEINIPRYKFVSPDRTFGGYDIIIGSEFRPPSLLSLTELQTQVVTKQIADFLLVMHATPPDIAAHIFNDEDHYWWAPSHAQKAIDEFRTWVFPKLDKNEIDWIEHQFGTYLSLSFEFETALTHADLVGDHIFFDEEKAEISGIIDFSDMHVSDPAFDFAGLWEYGESFVVDCLNHYESERKVDKGFLERSKFPLLASPVGNMLEIEKGDPIPTTFIKSRLRLQQLMDSGWTL